VALGGSAKAEGRGTALGSRAEAGYDSVSIGVYTGMGRPAKTDPNDFSNGLNTFVGSGAGTSGSGARNSYVGNQAGALTQGDANAGLGYGAGGGTSGNRNVAAGQYAGQFVTGDQNTHQGASAGVQSKGDNNIAIGTGASANLALASQSQNSPISQAMVQAASTAAQGELEGYLATRGVTVNGLNNGTYTIAANGDIVQASTGNVVFTAAEAQNAALKAFQRNGVGGIEASRTTAIGNLSRAVGDDSVALGSSAVAGDKTAVAVGNASKAYGASSVSIGDAAFAREAASIAVGQGAQALGVSSISIGTGNVVSGARSGAIGDPSFIDADDSYAIGNNNTIAAGAKQSFVLGNNVAVTNANNVVLGNNSADRAAVQVNSATVPTVIATLNPDGTVSYSAGSAITYGNFAGTATGVVSVGAAGAERQIVNVAPGAVTATSTDAINGSQLYNAVNTLSGSITTIVNNAQTHYYSVNDGGTKQGNYANDGASGANSVAAGAGASASGAGAVAVGSAATASAANSVAVGSNATAGTANSVALGNGSTTTAATPTASTTIQGQTYNFAGANPVGVVSVGAPGAERQIQNVAAGQLSATSTDAVNGSQLYATNQAVNNIQTGGGIKYFHANSQAADSQAAGAESVAIGPQAIALGNNSFAGGNGAQANGAGSIALGANAISTSSNGVAIGNGASADRAGMNGQKELFSNVSVLSTQGAVSVGSTGNERQITNVAGGTQATDAVNVRQLQAVQQSSVRYDTNVDGSVNYNSVTMGNGGGSGPVTVHNVAPGVAPTDAVNVQQLQGSVANSAAYTDARVNQMGQSIDEIGKKSYAGVAAAMAMESAPYVPGKVTYAAGMGYYERQSAVGVSLRKTADNGRWSVTGGASATTRGTVGFRVGVGGVWD
jgi:hypothetical protein